MTDMLSVVARAMYAAQDESWRVNHPWDMRGIAKTYTDLAKAAIEAHERALEEQGLVIVPQEPSDEMLRAWVVAKMKKDVDPDEMVPVPGTGQGDMQFWERWRNMADHLSLRQRCKAMIAALGGKE